MSLTDLYLLGLLNHLDLILVSSFSLNFSVLYFLTFVKLIEFVFYFLEVTHPYLLFFCSPF